MLFSDTYKTLTAQSESEFKDKGSRFIGYAFPVLCEDDAKKALLEVKKNHPAAAHHCYAFVLGPGQQIQKSNDDREPNNTAGKPILRAILSKQLTNTLIIVVRYFGGKLLGVPGLIHAYSETALLCIADHNITEKIVTERYQVTGKFEYENELYKVYKNFSVKIISHTYNADEFISDFEIRKSKAVEVVNLIREKRLFDIIFVQEN